MKPITSAILKQLDEAEKEATEARARLCDLRNEYAPKLKDAETAVSLAQSKLSAVIAIARAASGKG